MAATGWWCSSKTQGGRLVWLVPPPGSEGGNSRLQNPSSLIFTLVCLCHHRCPKLEIRAPFQKLTSRKMAFGVFDDTAREPVGGHLSANEDSFR